MGPAPGTSRPQQAGSWDGSGAPPLENARIKVGYAHSRAADAKRRSDPARAAADLVNLQRGLHVIGKHPPKTAGYSKLSLAAR